MASDLTKIYEELFAYCKAGNFAGHDPFDGLSSAVFRLTPLRWFAFTRLAWLQMVKRFPVDLRGVAMVPKGVNPKGLALFSLAEMSRFRVTGVELYSANAKKLIADMLSKKIAGKTADGQATTAFGYNFDWQSSVFYAPKGTPAIVPTAFASQALIEAYDAFGDESYLETADEICRFVLHSLNRSYETTDEVCFSYTPVDRTIIFNASLLAGECLARVGAIKNNRDYLDMAAKTARFVTRRQRGDGAWAYGKNDKQAWVDNFHTAYVLLSLHRISQLVPEIQSETVPVVKQGIDFWLGNLFLDDGTPKYYDNSTYPVDIHSAAAAISTMSELSDLDERMLPMARKTAEWTVANMRDVAGYFYYQKRPNRTVKTPFMRWGQAWMAYALARLIEAKK